MALAGRKPPEVIIDFKFVVIGTPVDQGVEFQFGHHLVNDRFDTPVDFGKLGLIAAPVPEQVFLDEEVGGVQVGCQELGVEEDVQEDAVLGFKVLATHFLRDLVSACLSRTKKCLLMA